MQVSIEQVNSLTRRMTVGIANERIQKAVQNRLQSVARTAKINGFRPGKVPMRLVEQKYGEQVYIDVLESIVPDSLGEALKEQSLNPVSKPDVELNSSLSALRKGEDLSYTATFEVYPELGEIKYGEAQVMRLVVEIDDADVDQVISKLRQQAAKWEEVTRSPTTEDKVIISVVATLDGLAFEDNAIKEEEMLLPHAESLAVGFSEALRGFMPGETRTLNLPAPSSYENPDLAGKLLTLETTLHAVKEAILPEMNTEFAISLGVESGDVTELRTEVTQNMRREQKQALRKYLRTSVLKQLREHNPIDVPNALVEQERDRLARVILQKLGGMGVAPGSNDYMRIVNTIKENMVRKEEPVENVHAGLLLSELIRAHRIELSAERLKEHITEIASTYEDPASIVRYIYSERDVLRQVESSVLEEQAIDWLLEQMQVTDEAMSFTQFMELANPRTVEPV
jgi:trigger factor